MFFFLFFSFLRYKGHPAHTTGQQKTTPTTDLSLSVLPCGEMSFTVCLHSLPPLLFVLRSFLLRLEDDPLFFRAAASAANVSFRDLLLLATEGVQGSVSSPEDTT